MDLRLKKQRNASFELLRILCMFMIVSWHFLLHGNWQTNMVGTNYVFGNLLQSVFRPSVNLFVMIGSYFMCNSQNTHVNLKKITKLYFTVLFYSVVLYIVARATGMQSYDKNELISTLLPLSTGKYWFVSAYMLIIIASPFLNMILRNITIKQHYLICAFFIVVGAYQAEFYIYFPQLPFYNGYNAFWFFALYFVASLIRRTDFSFTKKTYPLAIILYAASIIWGYFSRVEHNSAINMASTIIIFVFFKDLKIKEGTFSKIICSISSLTFGIYLIHDSMELKRYMYQNIFHSYKFYSSDVSFLILLGFIALTFAICACFEYLRKTAFNQIHVVFKKYAPRIKEKLSAKL